MSAFLGAVGFLTRVPVPVGVLSSESLARSVRWFPVVGALIGATLGALFAGLIEFLPAAVAAALVVTAGIVLTGAFHEDALGDVADAMGGRSPEDSARILKDPRQGTFGVLALVASFVVRVGALAAMDAATAVAFLIGAHAVARAGAVTMMRTPVTGGSALGAAYAGAVGPLDVAAAVIAGVLLGGLAAGPWVAAAVAIAALAAFVATRLALAKVGGITGDFLGAAEQLGEAGILVLGAALAYNSWSGPWWV